MTKHTDEWVAIPSQPGYWVTRDGRVRHGDRELKPYMRGSGYPCVHVSGKSRNIHILVAEAFIGPRPLGKCINHIDGNKCNPLVDNLEYVTQRENNAHAYRIGLNPGRRGSDTGVARLTECQIGEIRASTETTYRLARRLGVSESCIRHVRKGRTWKHISGGAA